MLTENDRIQDSSNRWNRFNRIDNRNENENESSVSSYTLSQSNRILSLETELNILTERENQLINETNESIVRFLNCLKIKTINNQIHLLHHIPLHTSVYSLKLLIQEKTGIDTDEQRLIYQGKLLSNFEKLQKYNVQEDHVIHLVTRSPNTNNNNNLTNDNNTTINNQSRSNLFAREHILDTNLVQSLERNRINPEYINERNQLMTETENEANEVYNNAINSTNTVNELQQLRERIQMEESNTASYLRTTLPLRQMYSDMESTRNTNRSLLETNEINNNEEIFNTNRRNNESQSSRVPVIASTDPSLSETTERISDVDLSLGTTFSSFRRFNGENIQRNTNSSILQQTESNDTTDVARRRRQRNRNRLFRLDHNDDIDETLRNQRIREWTNEADELLNILDSGVTDRSSSTASRLPNDVNTETPIANNIGDNHFRSVAEEHEEFIRQQTNELLDNTDERIRQTSAQLRGIYRQRRAARHSRSTANSSSGYSSRRFTSSSHAFSNSIRDEGNIRRNTRNGDIQRPNTSTIPSTSSSNNINTLDYSPLLLDATVSEQINQLSEIISDRSTFTLNNHTRSTANDVRRTAHDSLERNNIIHNSNHVSTNTLEPLCQAIQSLQTLLSMTNDSNGVRNFSIGQWIDVRDITGLWREGTILGTYNSSNNNRLLYINIDDHTDNNNEWIPLDSSRIDVFRTLTTDIIPTEPNRCPMLFNNHNNNNINTTSQRNNNIEMIESGIYNILQQITQLISNNNNNINNSNINNNNNTNNNNLNNQRTIRFSQIFDRLGRLLTHTSILMNEDNINLYNREQNNNILNTTRNPNLRRRRLEGNHMERNSRRRNNNRHNNINHNINRNTTATTNINNTTNNINNNEERSFLNPLRWFFRSNNNNNNGINR